MKTAAVIGLGDISAIHLSAIEHSPDIALVAVCDLQEAAHDRAPRGVPFFTDYKEMVRAVKPDCVHICLPHFLHYPVAKDAADLGCSVFCEKPLAISPAQAEEFAALEKDYPNQRFGVCLQNRFNDTTAALRAILDSGSYGSITGARGIVPWYRPKGYYDVKPWRGTYAEAGGGTMMNQSIHTLDLLYHLCGKVTRLHAASSRLLDYSIEVEDTVTARIEFASGAQGVFWATNCNYTNESIQLSIATEKAVFRIEDGCLTRRDKDGSVTAICEDRKLSGAKLYYGASHMEAIHRFYTALEKGGEDYLHASDGVMSIRLIDAIVRSAEADVPVELTY